MHPIADDFIYGSNARAGLWSAWAGEYIGWNGRYASNALVLSTPLNAGWITAYRIEAAGMLLATVASAYLFVRALARGLTRREVLACALGFTALYFSQLPSIGESVYWYTAAATYHVPLIVVLLHLALVIRYVRTEHPTVVDRLALAVAIALLIAAAGFNEVMVAMLLVLYGALAAATPAPDAGRGNRRLLFAVLFAVTLACAAAVYFSPGNAVREAMYPAHHRAGRSLGMTAIQTARFLSAWATGGALLLATVAFTPLAVKIWPRPPLDSARRPPYLGLAIAGLLLVVPIAVFPAYWETGVLGQHRTANTAFFAFLVVWFLAIGAWLGARTRASNALILFGHQVPGIAAALLVAAVGLTGNTYVVGADLVTGRLEAFDREMTHRYAELVSCREHGARTCEIEPIHTKPASFYVVDVSGDPANWVNVSYSRYFGVPDVRLKSSIVP